MAKTQEQIDYKALEATLRAELKQEKEDNKAQYDAWREEVKADHATMIAAHETALRSTLVQLTEAQNAFVKVRDNFMQCHARAIKASRDGALAGNLLNEIFQITK